MDMNRRGLIGAAALPLAAAAAAQAAPDATPSRTWATGGADRYGGALERLKS